MKSWPFVVTTPNKEELDKAVGRSTAALEIAGEAADLQRLLKAVGKVAEGSRSCRSARRRGEIVETWSEEEL